MEESALPGAVNNIIQRFQRLNIVTVPLYTSYIFLQRVNFLLRTGLANGRHSLRDAGVLLPAFIVLLCSSHCFKRKVSDSCALTNEKPGEKETVQCTMGGIGGFLKKVAPLIFAHFSPKNDGKSCNGRL